MVHFVGAGSGAPDLITLRGKRFLEEAMDYLKNTKQKMLITSCY